MRPDACLRRRNAKALKPPRLPILTFDEWQLRLALDGVFKVTWLMRGESLLSILWKFACANRRRKQSCHFGILIAMGFCASN